MTDCLWGVITINYMQCEWVKHRFTKAHHKSDVQQEIDSEGSVWPKCEETSQRTENLPCPTHIEHQAVNLVNSRQTIPGHFINAFTTSLFSFSVFTTFASMFECCQRQIHVQDCCHRMPTKQIVMLAKKKRENKRKSSGLTSSEKKPKKLAT